MSSRSTLKVLLSAISLLVLVGGAVLYGWRIGQMIGRCGLEAVRASHGVRQAEGKAQQMTGTYGHSSRD
jgi:hypothetical protein